MTLSILKAFTTTYAIVFGNLLTVVRIAWLPAAVLTVTNAWISLHAFDIQDALSRLPDEEAAPELILRAIAPSAGPVSALLIVALLASAVLSTGFLKWILRGEEPGIVYAAFGADELRLLASWLLMALALLGVYAAALTVVGVAVGLVSMVSPSAASLAGTALGATVFVIMLYMAARLSLVPPVVIRDGKWGISAGWAASRDNGWRLVGFWILVAFPVYAANTAFTILFIPGYFDYLSADATGQLELTRVLRERLGIMSAVGYLLNIPIWAILATASGVALRILTGEGIADHSRSNSSLT